MELAARVVRTATISYGPGDLPKSIKDYLDTAHCCVNPKCKGKYYRFENSAFFLNVFFFFQQEYSSTIASSISNLWISVENIVYLYCNIYAHQSKWTYERIGLNYIYSKFPFCFADALNRPIEHQSQSQAPAQVLAVLWCAKSYSDEIFG